MFARIISSGFPSRAHLRFYAFGCPCPTDFTHLASKRPVHASPAACNNAQLTPKKDPKSPKIRDLTRFSPKKAKKLATAQPIISQKTIPAHPHSPSFQFSIIPAAPIAAKMKKGVNSLKNLCEYH